jgi:hypothetical protein
MKRNYTLNHEGGVVRFTIEADDEIAFQAYEAKMKLVRDVKDFYMSLSETRKLIHSVDNAIELSERFMDEEMRNFFER